jgi:uncharacterized protein (DUF4415 family)
MARKPNPELIDDDNPEWTNEDFARARPAAEVLREQFGAEPAAYLLKPRRGRPPKAAPKRAINIRLSPEVIAHFRATGPGWQTRMDEVLKSHVARRRRRPGSARGGARRQPGA